MDTPTDVLELITPWFRDAPGRVAVAGRSGSLTYAELDEATARVAGELHEAGIAAGDGVLVHARLSPWAIVAMLGTLRAGARYVPVDAAFPPRRQALMARLGGVRHTLREPGLPSLQTVGDDAGKGLAYTCFTSGSTGTPKRIDVPVAALAYSTAARLAVYPEPVESFVLCSSLSFDSSVAGVYWTLACGGTLVLPSERPGDLVAIARATQRHAAGHTLMIPSLYRVLLSGGLVDLIGSLRVVIVAGEPCPPSVVAAHFERLPGAALYNEYGPTECTVWSTVHACRPDDAQGATVPIGRPIPGTVVAPRGTDGELWIEGPGVAAPNAGDAYRTGDLGRVRADGLLEFHGRRDLQVKLGGARIELAEIEEALLRHEQVEAAAVGVAAGDRGPRLAAYVVGRPGERPEPAALRRHLLAYLPAAAVPGTVVLVDRLPTQPNGKLDRRRLDALTAGEG